MAQRNSDPVHSHDAARQGRAPLPARQGRTSLAVAVVLFLIVVWTFLPSLRDGFVDYDDMLFVTGNPRVQAGLSWQNLIWALSHEVGANWHPLTTVSHMLDCEIYGLNPWGHHFLNILLHGFSAVLLFLAFRRMTGALWRSAALALLFALHPLRVESVTWISERKDVLSTFFWMLTLLAYARYAAVRTPDHQPATPTHGSGTYLLALLFFTLGLMSKPMLVTLPFVLLLLDYWPLNRFQLNTQGSRLTAPLLLIREKLPFFGLALVASAVAYAVQASARNIPASSVLPFATRAANAVVSYCRYLGTLFWPVDLSPFYPYPESWGVALVGWSSLALLGISALVLALGRQHRYLATGWFWFVGTLVPVIGLVQIGRQSMADHYTYIPSIGVLVMFVWGAHEMTVRWRYQAAVLSAATGAAVLVCIVLTRQQIGYWKDDESLWRHALAVTRNNDFAQYNLAFALAHRGDFDGAIPHYEEAIRINPRLEIAHDGLAFALVRKDRLAEAMREYEELLRLSPDDAAAHNSLGSLLAGQGRLKEAIQHFNKALRLEPDFLEAHYDLGLALASEGHYREAASQFREVLHLNPGHSNARHKLDQMLVAEEKTQRVIEPYRQAVRSRPDDVRAHADLGRVLLEAGRLDEAVQQYSEAARLAPKNAEIQYQLGAALSRKGEAQKAARQFELALEIEPKLAPAHYALGILYQHEGRIPEALEHWREAARLAPQWPDPLNSVAWVLATNPRPKLRDGPKAVELANRALALAGTNNVRVLDTLAAAYAESGRFAIAAYTARQARTAALSQGQPGLAEQIQQRLALYASNQPYREAPNVP